MTTPIADVMPYSVQFFLSGTSWWANIPAEQRNASSFTSRYHRLSPGTYRIQWSWKSAVNARPAHESPAGFEYQEWMAAGTSRFVHISVPPGGWLDVGLYLNPSGADADTDAGVLWVYPMATFSS